MTDFFYLVPVALVLGVAGLAAFMWSLRSGQYEDLDGAAQRILFDEDLPLKDAAEERRSTAQTGPPGDARDRADGSVTDRPSSH
ncbi:MAG: cbb3-type cytochrome oxidase assembly protein CcoS [Reyranella sp.]|nr:cbb3-type cytochrome oxidase assembly protein CcoS [Reyranella sp.]MDP3163347.1 cbb3-type cytochrome oxidase assembly protein CcoS [Reyranella sp.]